MGDTFAKHIQTNMLETSRLTIRPLNYGQLLKYILCNGALEEELGTLHVPRHVSQELEYALENTILPAVAENPDSYLFYTLWTAIDRMKNQMIGDVCIVGEPDSAGEIEIGYGTYPAFQNQGYMTEMVGGIISWVRTEPHVKAVTAYTEQNNKASCTVLERNGFIRQGEKGDNYRWWLPLDY